MTKHARLLLPSLRRSAGVGLVTAIFLVVVLAGLALAIVSLSSAQHVGSYLDVQGTLAYQAARAGAEVGIYRVRVEGTCKGETIAMPANTSLSTFTVTITCEPVAGPVEELNRHVVRATACNQPAVPGGACPNQNASVDYVQRVVEVRL